MHVHADRKAFTDTPNPFLDVAEHEHDDADASKR